MKFKIAIILILLLVLAGGALEYSRYRTRREAAQKKAREAMAEQVKVTFIEGWTSKDMADLLKKQKILDPQAFLDAAANWDSATYPFLKTKPAKATLEGYLFPDTYLVPKNPDPEDVIIRMLDNFGQRLEQAGIDPASAKYDIPGYGSYSLFQVLTLASIIEKETGRNLGALNDSQRAVLDEERKVIAGIFYNRLAKGMGLESDATINFISGKSDPSAQESDLNIDSPYNTYKYRGLPPGPISNPSLSSIKAAFFPTKTDYFYFLHKQPSGEVIYSKTFEEHRAKKLEFLK